MKTTHVHSTINLYLKLSPPLHMVTLQMKSLRLTACQTHPCFSSFSLLLSNIVTSEGDLWRPLGPPSLAPRRSETQQSVRHPTGQKGKHPKLSPHGSSQAHWEHIRTSGFYLPFYFGPAEGPQGRQVCQVPWLGPPDHVRHTLPVLHSQCRFSYPPHATEALFYDRVQPWPLSEGFKKTFTHQ